MTPFQHRIILPPILLVIHGVLLMPLFLPISPHGNELLIEGLPLHLQYSIPLGVIGFVVVMVTKQLAVKIPLPRDPRKKRLAEGLEWIVLFLVGFLEEVWRWGVVRILVKLEGGDGGYGTVSWIRTVRTKTEDLIAVENASGGPLWKGVYFMGWTWCCIESGFAWRSFAPHSEDGRHTAQHNHNHPHHHHHHHQRHDRSNRHRYEGSPQASPRASYYPQSRGSHGVSPSVEAADDANPFFSTVRTPVWEGSDLRQNLSKSNLSLRDPSRVEIHPTSADPSRAMFGSQCNFGGTCISGGQVATGSPQSPTTGRYNRDLEGGQRQEGSNSENEYGDDEDDCYASASESDYSSIRSSSETAGSRSATPLLSSSLPYDPNSQHPHQAFEQQSLLQSQYRRMSYNTLTEPVPAPSNATSNEDGGPEGEVIVRDHDQNDSSGGAARVSPLRPRAYPSYPSYSASYNHSYFSASPATRNRPFNLHLPGSPRSPLSPVDDGYFPQQLDQEQQQPQQSQRARPSRLPLHHYLRMIYGVDTNSLSIWLPILWRTAALFRSLGHVLLFAWFPSLIHKGDFQFWTLIMVSFISVQKGWYTVEWVGGTVARNGVIKVSIFTTLLSLVVYLVGLKLWCIIP
ncbi:hypothetical protein L211DRAFT_284869 [Terfezia boudieri ATCC MYA-4762]|uniref:Uncharacterized protein n=1 Tax=Terfezia boudieri ATCC MYA-4762 TaxID=1051890 RepID=A0A3N4LPV7_9PEZI|nr:hypothetical protein L211DRAFT_284869 [Terfezia boudieri ATCC MYA-4762]